MPVTLRDALELDEEQLREHSLQQLVEQARKLDLMSIWKLTNHVRLLNELRVVKHDAKRTTTTITQA